MGNIESKISASVFDEIDNVFGKEAVRVIEPSVRVLSTREEILLGLMHCEIDGRICYQSEMKEDGTIPFLKKLLKNHHESVFEHGYISVIFTTDRATTHQLVRHRMTSFSQESQRYCSYDKGKETDELIVVAPQELYVKALDGETEEQIKKDFERAAKSSYFFYKLMKKATGKAEIARSVLPNAAKTQIGVTANIRQWRHIFTERCSHHAQPDIRALMVALLKGLGEWSWLFEDIIVSEKGILHPVEVPTILNIKDVIAGCKDFYNCDFSPKTSD